MGGECEWGRVCTLYIVVLMLTQILSPFLFLVALGLKRMPNTCIVCGHTKAKAPCETKDVWMFRFPADQSRKEQWLKVVRLKVGDITEKSHICSQHFLAGDLLKCRHLILENVLPHQRNYIPSIVFNNDILLCNPVLCHPGNF